MKGKKLIILFLALCMFLTGLTMVQEIKAEEDKVPIDESSQQNSVNAEDFQVDDGVSNSEDPQQDYGTPIFELGEDTIPLSVKAGGEENDSGEEPGTESEEPSNQGLADNQLTASADNNVQIYENLNYWIIFVGPNAQSMKDSFPETIYILAQNNDGNKGYAPIVVHKSRGDKQIDDDGMAYYKPYIAEMISSNEGEEHFVAFNIRGKAVSPYPDYMFSLEGPVKEGEDLDNVDDRTIFLSFDKPYDEYKKDLFRHGSYSFLKASGGNVGKRGFGCLYSYEQVYQPTLEVKFIGGEPQPFSLPITMTGNYYNPDFSATANIELDNTKKENTYDLFDKMLALGPLERRDLDYFRMGATSSENLYKALNKYEINPPDLPGFTKEVTGDVAQGWTLTYTSTANEAPVLEVQNGQIILGAEFDLRSLIISARDKEDGDLTAKVEIVSTNGFDNNVAGMYHITFKVTDSAGASVTKIAMLEVQDKIMPPSETQVETQPTVVIIPQFNVSTNQPTVSIAQPSVTVIQRSTTTVPSTNYEHVNPARELPKTGEDDTIITAGVIFLILGLTGFVINHVYTTKKEKKSQSE